MDEGETERFGAERKAKDDWRFQKAKGVQDNSMVDIGPGRLFPLSAQTFQKAKMFVEQGKKLNLVAVSVDVQDDALVTITKGKSPAVLRISYSEITAMEYEKSQHRRWKTGLLLSPLFLLSKGKKHWFAIIRGEEETVFQLGKSNFSAILEAVESKSAKKVKMIASRG